jgi:hypothetical protein
LEAVYDFPVISVIALGGGQRWNGHFGAWFVFDTGGGCLFLAFQPFAGMKSKQ